MADEQASYGSDDDKNELPGGKTPAQWQKHWAREIQAATKRLRNFRRRGCEVVKRYTDERGKASDSPDATVEPAGVRRLNLFHTNVSTMKSMLFGSTPRIDISREHHDPGDDVARVSGLILQRMLQADVEPSGEGAPQVLQNSLEDRLLPGMGVARVRYEYDAEMRTTLDPMTGEEIEYEEVLDEYAPLDYVHWQDFLWGWCRTFAELPWMAFRAYMDKDAATARFGEAKAAMLDYKEQSPEGHDNREAGDRDEQSVEKKAEIWEIWCRKTEKVYFYSAGCEYILDVVDDPLGLDGFWPVPRPMAANTTTTLYEPVADFVIAQDLYNQVDELYTRICIITEAVKVVGVYDTTCDASVGRMLKEGLENDLIPVDNWAMLAEKGGLRGVIDFFPVEQVVNTLQTLRQVLGEQIELLYQVTGLSDILRGANTDQYTSDGTQQLKAKFGSIRVQALQEEFARFASDLEALRAEVITKHFSPKSIIKQSAAQFLPAADMRLVEPALQLLKNPGVKWRIDIRPESIAMVDYAQLKSERTEFLTAMATYLQSAQAMFTAAPEATPIMLEMLKWGMAGFKGADYLEGIMDQAIAASQQAQQQAQQRKQPSPEQVKAQTEQMKAQTAQMKAQADLQKVKAKATADMQTLQLKFAGEMRKLQAELDGDTQLEQLQFAQRMAELTKEFENDMALIREQLSADLAVEEAQSTFAVAEENVEHANEIDLLRRERAAGGQ